MSQRIVLRAALVASALLLVQTLASAQAPDNTHSNADPANSTDTAAVADGQKNDKQDLKVTQSIRKSVMADKDLSVNAHNVKIVTVNGYVTLNGIVRSDEEKASIEAKAIDVAGPDKVRNELKVAAQ